MKPDSFPSNSDVSKPVEARLAQVAVPIPVFQSFSYSIPESMQESPVPGCRVLVPFGNRSLTGMIVSLEQGEVAPGIREIREVLDPQPILSPKLLELAAWITRYYLSPLGEVLRTMLPPGLLNRNAASNRFSRKGGWPLKQQLAIQEVTPEEASLTPRQKSVVEALCNQKLPVLLTHFSREAGCSTSLLKNLAARGVLKIGEVQVSRSPWSSQSKPSSATRHRLTEDQQQIREAIRHRLDQGGFNSMLIHGITGSGKTEIYLNAIALVLGQRRSALVLVPEIGLTPQISAQFRGWFGDQVAILHSQLSEGERFDEWLRIRQGKARVVVGTRSAVFAPLPDLGIIVIDEEHDSSYKQEELPRYHARDTALKRGQLEGALVVLGSATPQLETYYASVQKGRPQYQILSSRIQERSLPRVHIVDMRIEFERHGKALVISDLLKEQLEQRMRRGEQALILLNRRGYSAALLCRSCGSTELCGNCSISLTYHQGLRRILCHYCGQSRPVPDRCSQCGKQYIYFIGDGTEKVQGLLRQQLPDAVIDRMDRDAVRRKGSMQRILERFGAGKTDILVGTQMIAKGHHFPKVTLVGVLSADQGLRLPDFRAAERTFQLLTQVAGRAGRGDREGEVVVQTFYPNHYSLKSSHLQDYSTFFQREIQFRRRFQYPPFSALVNLLVQDRDRQKANRLATELCSLLIHHRKACSTADRMRVLGPAPAVLERLKGQYRFQILIKTIRRQEAHEVIRRSLASLREKKWNLSKVSVDVDPLTLM